MPRHIPSIRLILHVLVLALAVMVLPRLASAQPVATENAVAELIAEGPAVPGRTLSVALKLVARPGWHTYWVNPGDTGLATTIVWTVPQGVSAGAIAWPRPEAIPVGPFMNYGFEGETWLLTDIAVPEGFAGGTLELRARADWLICAEICVPEGADLSLSVPVAATFAADPAHALGFEQAREKLPLPLGEPVVATRAGDSLEILLPASMKVATARFFPFDGDSIVAAAPQVFDGSRLTATLEKDFKGTRLSGVIVVGGGGWTRSYVVDTPLASVAPAASAATAPPPAPAPDAPDIGILLALAFAFVGGLILNLMPCVLPVLSIKVLSMAGKGPGPVVRHHGIAYTLGVLACFALLAGALLTLRAGGESIGWGFQLQSPIVVSLLGYLFFALGLWMLDIVSFGNRLMGAGEGLVRRGGLAGTFGTGLLAAVVATPCTAPFMGAALGFALTRPAHEAFAVFMALGLGLSSPFLLISFVPGLARLLPKPGGWMVRLKKLLAFPLFASTVWLLWVLAVQSGPMGVAAAGAGLLLIALAAFLVHEFGGVGGRLVGTAAVIGALVLAAMPAESGAGKGLADQAGAEPYNPERLLALRTEGKPVFVNLTAAWCITCLVNEQVALERPAVKDALASTGTVYMIGDWTNRDGTITRLLAENGRSGVPLYLLYRPGADRPVVLPQLLTEGLVVEALTGR
ncbi:protein-disulfide reductase DsbD family protein [Zavarzinia aquatilis]|uniref:Thiol:disulfide interchange protein n=1 Tax=Zavarzinia aquatilis TaxID=2211142 RepID=A0A317DUZ1_9PROT|nr:protein-disulfide reductase DsbD domain-containing protein [Zavarzinia aquatilis]PWR18499.1 thiol:disulfide interchange protein [Zavarzinia aquatilis]